MTKKHGPKKIMFVLPALSAGGAERVLITLMNEIDRKRFIPEFIALRKNGPLKKLIADDITIHHIGSYKHIICSLIPLLKKINNEKPDVIVTTMAHTNFLILIIKPFLQKKARIIIREAITPSFILETHKFGWLVKILYKILYPTSNLVISPSQRIIDEFKHLLHINTKHYKLLYNPVDTNQTRSSLIPTFQNTEERKNTVLFICAGRLHQQKGFDQLIESLPLFHCDYDWHLTILGNGSERKNLDNLIKKHHLDNKITFKGYTKTPWPEIASADCFLLPSRYEGLPNVVLESLSVGTPVIATDSSGGIKEIQKKSINGTVTVVKTMQEFLNQMTKIKPNPTNQYRDSLLPDEFKTTVVINKFMDMIDNK
ncbi:MAG: glycosyltransferase [Alphaproteobacteria bacterium]|nr:glycosyltransferase [Alphaproteobacteria bacterium]